MIQRKQNANNLKHNDNYKHGISSNVHCHNRIYVQYLMGPIVRYSTKVRYRATAAMSKPNTQSRPATSFEANSYTSEALMARIPAAIVHPIVLVIQWLTKAAPMILSDDVIASTCKCTRLRPNTLDFDMQCAAGQELCSCAVHYCSRHTTCLYTHTLTDRHPSTLAVTNFTSDAHGHAKQRTKWQSYWHQGRGQRGRGQRADVRLTGMRAKGSCTLCSTLIHSFRLSSLVSWFLKARATSSVGAMAADLVMAMRCHLTTFRFRNPPMTN